ncbi:hypothetical protein IW261DRAFT_869569 [Armillaria novae-zelandiae]|uniref:Uncharacterized protein n=1 Tax=Armillaria novae-zelandiae TaxID=153914 RepID=A0AA39PJC5_9AGAR|nr:hypothetical protein IW261DRAFT_869569 [Armillaria novae-zelandiae]
MLKRRHPVIGWWEYILPSPALLLSVVIHIHGQRLQRQSPITIRWYVLTWMCESIFRQYFLAGDYRSTNPSFILRPREMKYYWESDWLAIYNA